MILKNTAFAVIVFRTYMCVGSHCSDRENDFLEICRNNRHLSHRDLALSRYALSFSSRANVLFLSAAAAVVVVLSIYLESAGRTINFILSPRGTRSGRRGNAF